MKWMIASDIHGSALYCKQLLQCYREEQADRLLLLGDVLYHGPRNDLPNGYAPKQVIEMLNAIRNEILCVRGNCDAEVDQMVLQFPIGADCAMVDMDGVRVVAMHGHQQQDGRMPVLTEGTVLLCGHTHIPECAEMPYGVRMNPGSVSIPKEGSRHGYMTAENGVFLWKTLCGETQREYCISGASALSAQA